MENSATQIWSVLSELSFFPALWNILPFHPHEANDRKSNRTPTPREVREYSYFVEELLNLFPSINRESGIFAIGRKAEERLKELGKNVSYIRHPSHGGAGECRKQIVKISNFVQKITK
jgi:hypothetical protein